MAKSIEKDAHTFDERLAQALVQIDEQPYEVPANWVWITVAQLVDLHRGVTYSKNEASQEKSTNSCLVLRGGNIEEGSINLENDNIYVSLSIIKNNQLLKKNDIVIVSSTGSIKVIGRAGISQNDYNDIAFGAFLTLVRPKYNNKKYISFFFQTENYRNIIRGLVKGVNINNIKNEYIENIPFPLPPLNEQQRIVEHIESLFAKLDTAKELAQSALDSFEIRKAAVLHKAFTGELTQNLCDDDVSEIFNNINRVKNDLIQRKVMQRPKRIAPVEDSDKISGIPQCWKACKLGEIAFVTKLAGFEYTKYIHLEEHGEIPVIRAQNVRNGYLDITNLLYIRSEVSDILNRSALTKKSLLVTFIGAGIGDVCLFNEQRRFHLAPNVAKVEIYNDEHEYVISEYVLYFLLSPLGQRQIIKHLKATAQPSLSMETIRDIVINVPPISTQKEIVRILDSVFEKEQQAKELCDVIGKIDLMKKAILARAFRGELGTNDPAEESALELLKECLKG